MSQGCAEKVSGSWMETGYANTAAAASLSVLWVVPGLLSSAWPKKKKKSKSQRLTPWPGANSVHRPQRVNKLRLEDSTCTLRCAHSCKKCLWKMRQFNFILKLCVLFNQWSGLEMDIRKQGRHPSPFGVGLLCTAVLRFLFLFNFCMRTKDSFKIEPTAEHACRGYKSSPVFFSSPSFLSSSTLGLFAPFLWLATFFLPPSPSSSESENSSSQAILLSEARTEIKRDTIWHRWQQQTWLKPPCKCFGLNVWKSDTDAHVHLVYVKLWSKLFDLTCILVILSIACSVSCLTALSNSSMYVLQSVLGVLASGQAQNTFSWHVSCAATNSQPIHPEERTRVDCLCFRSFPFSHFPEWLEKWELCPALRYLTSPTRGSKWISDKIKLTLHGLDGTQQQAIELKISVSKVAGRSTAKPQGFNLKW